jgi:hypothetical protein
MNYKLYFLDPKTAKPQKLEIIQAPHAAEAIRQARQRARRAPIELWCDRRKIFSAGV